MNAKTKIALAAAAALLTGAAIASADCSAFVGNPGGTPIRARTNPLSVSCGGATGQAFGVAGSFVSANMIGNANFADTFGYTSAGSQIIGCHAIDASVSSSVIDTDAVGCGSATKQDVFLHTI